MIPRLARFGLSAFLLTASTIPAAAVTVNVDVSQNRRAIDPRIYGVNHGSAAEFAALPYPLRRWGGNSTTRYSWQNDTHNTGFDWFFQNIASQHPNPALLPNGSEADLFVQATRAADADAILTASMIGWTPKSRAKTWGFSIAKYGAQQDNECIRTGYPFWCTEDSGNGIRTNGTRILNADPADTSVPIGPAFIDGWIDHLSATFGDANSGGVRFWSLDNEPMLWNSTHQDVHPQPLSYDSLWAKTKRIAGQIKVSDPAAKTLGPVSWGWCEYFYSAVDGCSPGPDQAAHGNLGLIEWYLQQVAAHETATGVRLVDYLDVHYYPQASGITFSDDESGATSAMRLRAVKSLYDPAYVDESWIGQPVRLIPRLKAMIAARAPGLGLAITEYQFGNDHGISSALAQAEALAVFGREGVDLATRWVAPANGSRVQDAFRLYLDYDGDGGQVSGHSVKAASASVDQLGSYAVDGSGGELYLLLFNKTTAALPADVTIADGRTAAAALHRFTGSSALGPAGTDTVTAGALSLSLPARSATLVVIAPNALAVDEATGLGAFALRAAPNPSRASTLVSFTLPASGEVTLEVLDLAGRRVATLHTGVLAAGAHALAWDGAHDAGRAAAPGVYLVRLRALDRSTTVRVTRVR